MCGIVGVAGFVGFNEEKVFKNMLQMDVLRGKDSTGIVCVDRFGDVTTAKEAWLPQDLLSTRDAKAIFAKSNITCLIGHNRAATVGEINKATAHPFEFENIVGVHNGTTDKWRFKRGQSFTVDSEALYDHANTEGMRDAWAHVSKAASLAYYDKRDNKLHLLRNNERPMCVAYSDDMRTLFFASEAWMIRGACARNNITLNAEFGVRNTATNKVYDFDLASIKDYECEEVTPYTYTPTTTPFSNNKNTTASFATQVRIGETVDFKVVKFEETEFGTRFDITTTSTKLPIDGQCFVPKVQKKTTKCLKEGNEFNGRVQSTCAGTSAWISVSWTGVTEYVEDDDDDLLTDSFTIEGDTKEYTREMFMNQDGISNECLWCSDPLSFDQLNFLVTNEGNSSKRDCICESCAEDEWLRDYTSTYTDLKEVYPVLTH